MMKAGKIALTFVGLAAALCGTVSAQTNYVIVTNVVTITITNVVTVTNVVAPMAAPVPAVAVKVQPAPSLPPKYPWQNAISAGLTLTRGNSDTMLFTADYLTQRKTPFDEYKLGMSAAYGNQASTETVNNYDAFGQWNHLFTPRFYGYARIDGSRDIISEVDYRVTVGPGLGYYLIKSANTTLALEGGGAFEAQRLDSEGDSTFATIRAAERFEHKFNDRARVWQNVEILPQVDKFDNYIVNFEIGLEASVTKSFALKSYLDDNYDNRPATGKLKNDAKLVTALTYKF